MNIVFMGTPDFAVSALKSLINNKYNVIAVYTKEPKPIGRKQILTKSPVHIVAEENNIPVYTPKNFREEAIVEQLKKLNPDILIVAAYGIILPESVLCIPRMGAVNIHASLLPKHRGANPIQRAIMEGDTKTGITIMKMDKGMDTGDMLLKGEISIDNDISYGELEDKLSVIGADLIIQYLENMDTYPPQKQPNDSTIAPKLDKKEAKIDWSGMTASQIHNLIRGLNPYPFAYLDHKGSVIKVIKSEVLPETKIISDKVKPGLVVNDIKNSKESKKNVGIRIAKNFVDVLCCDGSILRILEMQRVGGKPMNARDFLNGYEIELGENLVDGEV